MTDLLTLAVAAMTRLPAVEQDELAGRILYELRPLVVEQGDQRAQRADDRQQDHYRRAVAA